MARDRREIRWSVPTEYHRAKIEADLAEARMMLPRLFLRVGLPTYLLCLGFLLWLRRCLPVGEHKYIIHAIVMLGVIAVGLFLWLYVMLLARRFERVRVWLKARGIVYRSHWWPWTSLAWYRIADVEEFPQLRMLQLGFAGRNGNEHIQELVFDPAEVEERELSAFMAEVRPDKERFCRADG